MTIELAIYKLLLVKSIYLKYFKYIQNDNNKVFSRVLVTLHNNLDRNIAFSEFKLACLQEDSTLLGVLNDLEALDVSEDAASGIIHTYCERIWGHNVALAAIDVAEGKSTVDKLMEVIHSFTDTLPQENWDKYKISDNISDLLSEIDRNGGLQWRLPWLNKVIGGIHKGDFGFVFARTNAGKSTFIASEVSNMLSQLDQPCCFFFNEENGARMKMRVIQAYFGVDIDTIKRNESIFQGKFDKETKKLFHFYNMAMIQKREVEAICKEYTPGLIIVDNIDKIHGFKADREDIRLGNIYTWARELAKTYSPFIAVCQAGATAENKKWLQHTDIKDAHTSKSSEADFIIGVGHSFETGYEDIRFLRLVKNKFIPGEHRCEVRIEPFKARYSELS